MGYFVDSLFRKDINAAATASVSRRKRRYARILSKANLCRIQPEVTRIFMNSIRTGPLPAEDIRYVGQIVAQRTGLTELDAEKRVIDTYARVQTKLREAETAAKEAADSHAKLLPMRRCGFSSRCSSVHSSPALRLLMAADSVTCNYYHTTTLLKETNNALNTFVLSRHPHSHHHSDCVVRTLNALSMLSGATQNWSHRKK